MNTSDWIALGSLVVSAGAILWTWMTSRKLNKQQQLINDFTIIKQAEEANEMKKASIQVISESRGLFVRNQGRAIARNIRINSAALQDPNSNIEIITQGILPYGELHPNDHFQLEVIRASGYLRSINATVLWDDDFAQNNQKDITLQFL
jgi:hypothetical protein